MEVTPPTIKAAVVNPFGISGSSNSAVKNIKIENRIIKINKKRYSCFKNVIAPYHKVNKFLNTF